MIPAIQNKKNFWNPTREIGYNLIRRKLLNLETLAKDPARVRSALFNRVTCTLFWQQIANFAIIPNLHVSLIGFQKFFLFWIGGIILEGWEAELATAPVIGN